LGAWYLWRLNDNSRPFPPLAWESQCDIPKFLCDYWL
jgi:hypothetical protein